MDQIIQNVESLKIAPSDQPSSTNWFDLPLEMREMVIDRMDSETRCRFAQCSKLCKKEAKNSKNYLHDIHVDERFMKIELGYEGYIGSGYCLQFIDAKHEDTIVVYRSDKNVRGNHTTQKWIKHESGYPKHVMAKYAKKYLEKFKHSVRFFRFDGDYSMLKNFNLNNLQRLKHIVLYSYPHKFGSVSKLDRRFIQIDKLLSIKTICMEDDKFTFDQVVNFRGQNAYIVSDEFNEENIKKYLKMWKNGEIHENVETLEIGIKIVGDVTLRNITEGLEVYDYKVFTDGGENVWCCFSSKSKVRGDKLFHVTFKPLQRFEITWSEPEADPWDQISDLIV